MLVDMTRRKSRLISAVYAKQEAGGQLEGNTGGRSLKCFQGEGAARFLLTTTNQGSVVRLKLSLRTRHELDSPPSDGDISIHRTLLAACQSRFSKLIMPVTDLIPREGTIIVK